MATCTSGRPILTLPLGNPSDKPCGRKLNEIAYVNRKGENSICFVCQKCDRG